MIGTCYVVCPSLLLLIRAVLVRENRIRDAERVDDGQRYVIERIAEDGKRLDTFIYAPRSYELTGCDSRELVVGGPSQVG
jgi:hypothetical protein